jgi:hypothetical protein
MVVVRCMDPMPASGKAGYSRRGALREIRRLTAYEYCRLRSTAGGQVRPGWFTETACRGCYCAKPGPSYS